MFCLGITGPVISDYSKRLILLSKIQLNGGNCIDLKQFRKKSRNEDEDDSGDWKNFVRRVDENPVVVSADFSVNT